MLRQNFTLLKVAPLCNRYRKNDNPYVNFFHDNFSQIRSELGVIRWAIMSHRAGGLLGVMHAFLLISSSLR